MDAPLGRIGLISGDIVALKDGGTSQAKLTRGRPEAAFA
jgi:hypothetical protein